VEPLPAWLTPLLDAETMRMVDRWAIEQRGIGGLDLMERAGAGVTRAIEQLDPDGPVCVLCGKGNNGGDGLVVARLLRDAGREVSVICIASPEDFSGDARVNLERLPGAGPLRLDGTPWGDGEPGQPGPALGASRVVVDALLGTGFEGEPRGDAATAIAAINATDASIVSVDIPSGVDASTGAVASEAVRASMTVTFHAHKPGLFIRPGKAHAGTVRRIDIGIPRGGPIATQIGILKPSVLEGIPVRDGESSKFTSGHVIVAGGSLGLSGAPVMCARAAMRSGAGYVTVCVPRSLQPIVAGAGHPELMSRGIAEEQGGPAPGAVAEVIDAAARGGALALGPGLGRTEGAAAFARELAGKAQLSLVLDADGLNAHAGSLARLAAREAPTILTPHAGELARVLELTAAEVEAQRLAHARAAAVQAGAVVVLKGSDTIVADPSGLAAVNALSSPALATAGTGDVLSGVIAALLAKGLAPFHAAAAAVHLHARAGVEAARRLGGPDGVIASDVIEALAHVPHASTSVTRETEAR
jgi:hydroxyethylthiazole kinase-like uncharacterized protein yjeF